MDSRKCQVVEMRFFGGLSIEETAEALDVSVGTVHARLAAGEGLAGARARRARASRVVRRATAATVFCSAATASVRERRTSTICSSAASRDITKVSCAA